MKKTKFLYSILSLLAFAFVLSACSSDDDFEHEDSFKKSQKVFNQFKTESKNSYTYTVVNASWSGFSCETVIIVKSGEVIRRDFKLLVNNEMTQEWTETKADLNTHKDTPAAQAITLDEVYVKAETDWLLKRKNNKNYFETLNKGMISTCGYSENGCMDDCFHGITIKSIEAVVF